MEDDKQINVHELVFDRFGCQDVDGLREYYFMRPNKTCDSAPLDSYIWREYYDVKKCVVDEHCMLMTECDDGIMAAAIPLCREEDLPKYFRVLERYFNEVLKKPLIIFLADEEGVNVLKEAGALDDYEVREEEDLKDYLYDAEALRTLAGRKYSKKRNHIHKFEEAYEGRWEYRTLTSEDKLDILSYLSEWKLQKDEVGEGSGIDANEESYDAMESLDAEILGVHDILNNDCVFDNVRIGGIYIDGRLRAFSIGNYNPREKMAVIDIEKADPDITGLYQIINREFLIHEFPEAEIVNREDDVGLPGLRRAKLSYYPIDYARKYLIKQLDYKGIEE